MEHIRLDEQWSFRRGLLDMVGQLDTVPCVQVNLPHDGMIGTKVSPDAPAGSDSGYFNGDVCNYTKFLMIPAEWEGDHIGLQFDGAMMHTSIDVNGCKVGEHHYGYSPFYVDISDYVTFGEENRITVNLNTGVQPSSRWYTGSGLFRGVELRHAPKVHVAADGVYVYTKEVTEDAAYLEALVDVCNNSSENRLVEVRVSLAEEGSETRAAFTKRVIQVNPRSQEMARIALILKNPKLWDADEPNLYTVKAEAEDTGVFRTHFTANKQNTVDTETALFGVRMITADPIRGLRINGKTTKLKGGCLHHDNGLLGAVSLYESEARKVQKLKSIGFNAIRTTHNPPSKALVEACDRLGMYIFDEAFDAWGIAKRTGDYSMYFATQWKQDLTAFVRRDRVHPSVIIWSTGNEIPERAGLNNGYKLAAELAETIHSLDATRPVSNGICSLWCGLDDHMTRGQSQLQNAGTSIPDLWENYTEPYTNGMDIVGYNYGEDMYEHDHEMFPERVILGSENFPQEIGYRWPMVESLPYVIGEFTWTAWDYIGEAGIGKAVYVDADDPMVGKGPWALMPQMTSHFPWRTANDADFDITGLMLPQGAYRSVVWGSEKTHLYSLHPQDSGKVEILSPWGFPGVLKNWNYTGFEGQKTELVVFTKADEVEILLNGVSVEKKPVSKECPFPNSVRFLIPYESGKVESVSYVNGAEISRDALETTKAPAKISLLPEKTVLRADGHDLVYIGIEILDEDDKVVSDAAVELTAEVSGSAYLAGFGTGKPQTDENYTDDKTITYRGRAMAILRSGYKAGETVLKISAAGLESVEVRIQG